MMWKKLKFHEGFLYTITTTELSYAFHLTDLGQLWSEEVSSDAVSARCKELNPRAQVSLEKLLQLVETFPQVAVHSDMKKDDKNLTLSKKRLLGGIPFNWSYQLNVQNSEEFKKLVTVPLIEAAALATTKIEQLETIIYKKDKEIDDYKSSGARVSRRHLETVPFSKDHFHLEHETKLAEENICRDPLETFCSLTQNVISRITKTANKVTQELPTSERSLDNGTESSGSESSRDSVPETSERVPESVKPETPVRENKRREHAAEKSKPAVKKKILRI